MKGGAFSAQLSALNFVQLNLSRSLTPARCRWWDHRHLAGVRDVLLVCIAKIQGSRKTLRLIQPIVYTSGSGALQPSLCPHRAAQQRQSCSMWRQCVTSSSHTLHIAGPCCLLHPFLLLLLGLDKIYIDPGPSSPLYSVRHIRPRETSSPLAECAAHPHPPAVTDHCRDLAERLAKCQPLCEVSAVGSPASGPVREHRAAMSVAGCFAPST